jgi:hypothetical protein
MVVPMGEDGPFDYFQDRPYESGAGAHWAARAPQRPSDRFDLKLVPRALARSGDASALEALARVEREPWAGRLTQVDNGVELRLDDGWIETLGAALQDGDGGEERLAELARGQRFAVQFCDANATEELHTGHLRNLALGNALAASLAQAGATVERRSLIADADADADASSGEGRAGRLAGQRRTLRGLGIVFDRTFRESAFRPEAAELTARSLALGERLPGGHICALAYWVAAPKLEGTTSIWVCGEGWAPEVVRCRALVGELMSEGVDDVHPTYEVFYGRPSTGAQVRASVGQSLPLIDELIEWLRAEIEGHPRGQEMLVRLGPAERVAARVALGYFLPRALIPRVDLLPEKLLRTRESPGWELARARAHEGCALEPSGRPAEDPDYRFAVVQSELHRSELRLAVERLDTGPLARHVVQLARWYLQRDRSEAVERVVRTVLDRGARGLGLE